MRDRHAKMLKRLGCAEEDGRNWALVDQYKKYVYICVCIYIYVCVYMYHFSIYIIYQ